jgi:hypothetical protein
MSKLDGWQRLAVVLTLTWAAGLLTYIAYEWHAVSDGESPTMFVVLRDAKTQKEFGRLSTSEINELGRLTHERSLSSQAEPGDAEEAKFLLAASPDPTMRYARVIGWIFLPIVCFWAFFLGIRWVVAGFRRVAP